MYDITVSVDTQVGRKVVTLRENRKIRKEFRVLTWLNIVEDRCHHWTVWIIKLIVLGL